MRRPDKSALTVVNQYEKEKQINSPINVKVQCMHCDHPACVSACIVGAFPKKKTVRLFGIQINVSAAAIVWLHVLSRFHHLNMIKH